MRLLGAGLFARRELRLGCLQRLALAGDGVVLGAVGGHGVLSFLGGGALGLLDRLARLCPLQEVFGAGLRGSGAAHQLAARLFVAVLARGGEMLLRLLLGGDGLGEGIVTAAGEFGIESLFGLGLRLVAASAVRGNLHPALEFVHQFSGLGHLPAGGVEVAFAELPREVARLDRGGFLHALPRLELAVVERLFAHDLIRRARKGLLPGREVLGLLEVLQPLHALAERLVHLLQGVHCLAQLLGGGFERVGAAAGLVELRGLEALQRGVEPLFARGLDHVGDRLEAEVLSQALLQLVEALVRLGRLVHRVLHGPVGALIHLPLAADLVLRLVGLVLGGDKPAAGFLQEPAGRRLRLGQALHAVAGGVHLELHDDRHRGGGVGTAALRGECVFRNDVKRDAARAGEVEGGKVDFVRPLPERGAGLHEQRDRTQLAPLASVHPATQHRAGDAEVVAGRNLEGKLRVRREAQGLRRRALDDHGGRKIEEAPDQAAAARRGETLLADEVERPGRHAVRDHFVGVGGAAVDEQRRPDRAAAEVDGEGDVRSLDGLDGGNVVVGDDARRAADIAWVVDARRERVVARHFADANGVVARDRGPRAHPVAPLRLGEVGRGLVDAVLHLLGELLAPAERGAAGDADARSVVDPVGHRRLDAHDRSGEHDDVARFHDYVAGVEVADVYPRRDHAHEEPAGEVRHGHKGKDEQQRDRGQRLQPADHRARGELAFHVDGRGRGGGLVGQDLDQSLGEAWAPVAAHRGVGELDEGSEAFLVLGMACVEDLRHPPRIEPARERAHDGEPGRRKDADVERGGEQPARDVGV